LLVLKTACEILCAIRGLRVDIQSENQCVFISVV
jgi:hypothetical protein